MTQPIIPKILFGFAEGSDDEIVVVNTKGETSTVSIDDVGKHILAAMRDPDLPQVEVDAVVSDASKFNKPEEKAARGMFLLARKFVAMEYGDDAVESVDSIVSYLSKQITAVTGGSHAGKRSRMWAARSKRRKSSRSRQQQQRALPSSS